MPPGNRKLISKLEKLWEKFTPKRSFKPEDGLDYWREHIFLQFVSVMLLLGIILLLQVTLLDFQLQDTALIVVDLLAFSAVAFAAFAKKLKFRTRVHILMVIVYTIGLNLQIIGGTVGNGNVVLFMFPALAAILLGMREAAIALGLNFITLLILGILLSLGKLSDTGMAQYTLHQWIATASGLLFFNTLFTISISSLLRGYTKSYEGIKTARTALRESQERYQAIIEDQIELIDRWLPDGTLTFVNQAAADFSGIPREELIGMNFFSFLQEEDQAQLKEHIKTLTPAHPVVTMEEVITINGETNWIRWTNRALFNEKGEIQEFQSVGSDITERKRAEESLERSESRYRAIVETQSEIISRWRPDGSLTFINDAGCRFYGKPFEELLKISIIDLAPSQEKQKLRDYIASFSVENPSQTVQFSGPDKDGNNHWFEWRDNAIIEKGRIVEFQSVGRDITEEKQIRDELLKSEARYRAVIEDQVELIGRLSPDGKINFFNHAFAHFYGLNPDENFGISVFDLIESEEAATLMREFNRLSPENPIHSNTYLERNASGESRWYTWTNHGIFDAYGNLIEIQVIGQDVHEQRKAEQALQDSEARYRAVVEDQVELICRMLPDGTINFTNHAYARFFGMVPEDLIGSNLADVIGPEEAEELLGYFTALTLQQPVYLNIHLETNNNGENRWFRWTNHGIFDSEGNLREIQAIGQDIHERKLAEQALQESETRYRAVVEDQVEMICRMLPEGTYTFVNNAYARFYGKTPEELIGRNVQEIIPPEIAASSIENSRKLTPEEPLLQKISFETNAKGENRWFSWTDRGIFNGNGKLIEIQAIGRDIHEQILAEQALQKSEARYRAIVEDQVEMICRIVPGGTYTFVNNAYARFYGKTPGELIGRNVQEIIPSEVAASSKKNSKNLTPEEPLVQNISIETNAKGENRWFLWTDRGIFDENGNLIEIQGIGRDIHEQILAEQALEKSEARYRAIVENQIEPVCRWLPDFTLTFVNDAYCNLFNKLRDELLGKSIKSTVPDEDWMIIEQMVLDLKTGASSAVDENRVITANGVRWLQWALSAIRDENGAIIEFQSVGHDTSEQKHTQQMLEKTLSDQIKLSQANSELAERLEGLYLTDVNRHETQLRYLASELHDDVLNALAVFSTNIDLEEIPAHVSQAYEQAVQRTREIVSGLRTAMLNYGLYIGLETLADELSDQLPDGPLIYIDVPHSVIRYDPEVELHLFRIAQEACSNAIKHANASEIHIRGELDVERVLLEISDNGSGFDAEEILDLPDLLRKEHFGLAGMFERAELIHGELSINAVPQEGTRVRVVWHASPAAKHTA